MLSVMGASLKILNTEKQTPLHIACEMGNIEVVQLLLNLGIQTGVKDINGMTAYDFAKRSEYQDILDILNEYDVNKMNEAGQIAQNSPNGQNSSNTQNQKASK